MRFDAALGVDTAHLRAIPAIASAAEHAGFAGIWVAETQHNGFLPLALVAEHTTRVELGTAVAIAFARSPMVTAQTAWDLQAMSSGRFVLGLGTQVKAHIERRFGVPWDAPVPRLREYIQALRAIWDAWQNGGKLDFRGRFYQHTLMTPFFNPGPIEHPRIPIYIAGVNEGLARLAGETCDGFHVHPFHSVAYINRLVRPQIARGAEEAGRSPQDVQLASSVFVITGGDDAAMERSRQAVRSQIAFYASTPSYRTVLDVHGWGAVGAQLSQLAAAKRWNDMGALIGDDMLAVFAVEAPYSTLGEALYARYNGVIDRIACYMPYHPGEHDDLWRSIAQQWSAPN